MTRWTLYVLATLVPACVPQHPSLDGTEFRCDASGDECPAGFDCVGGTCIAASARPRAGVHFECLFAPPYDASSRTAVLDAIKTAGIAAVRIDLGWDGIEDTGRGARNNGYLATADYCVTEARSRGLAVTFAVYGTPAWANGGAGANTPPDDPADFAAFVGWAADRWARQVEAWQIWIEPERSESFSGTLSAYADLLAAAYPAIKTADPAATVVLGAPSSNDDLWVEQLYQAGAGAAFDVLALEPFQGVSDAEPETIDDGSKDVFSHFPAVRAVMTSHGDGAKPVWFTGFGWSAHDNAAGIPEYERGVTEAQQADYAVRAFEMAASRFVGVDSMFWHKEWGSSTDVDVHQQGFGLLRADLSARPVLDALHAYLAP